MPIRDTVLTFCILVLVPFAVAHPWIGIMLWTWISVMNPHRLSWGFAFYFPFAQIVAIAVLLGLLLSRDEKKFPFNPITVTLIALIMWMCVTTVFAVYPDLVWDQFFKVMKIQVMLLVTLAVLHTRRHIDILVWVLVISVGYFGTKGGLFTLIKGGGQRVWGPPGGFFGENNALAVATLMVIPLMVYLRRQAHNAWLSSALLAATILCGFSALGSQSRGGLIAAGAMVLFLWLHSRKRVLYAVPFVVLSALALAFMPETWWHRMETMETYEEDRSAMGRINAWSMAFNLANDRFLGAGFYTFTQELFDKYSPNPADGARAAHSIYFQMLGEHGWIGLCLFITFWLLGWIGAGTLQREARKQGSTAWAFDLGSMVKVSMVAYLVGGAFLSLAYFDVPYLLVVLVVLATRAVRQQKFEAMPSTRRAAESAPTERAPAS